MPGPTFLLVHSPLVGPATWAPVADELRARGRAVALPSLTGMAQAPAPQWRHAVATVAAAAAELDGPLVLAGHSGAGLLLPAIAAAIGPDRTTALLFVDASLPPDEGDLPLAPPQFAEQLGNMARDGLLPTWDRWFRRKAVHALLPDRAVRERVIGELPSLPLSYFTSTLAVPAGWRALPAAYLLLTENYAARAGEATGHGWPVGRLDGVEHLAMVTHPRAVTDALLDLEGRLSADRPARPG